MPRWRLHRICRVLHIEPYAKTITYILDDDDGILYGGRRCGKTTAVILDILVRRKVPMTRLCSSDLRTFDMILLHRDPDYSVVTGQRFATNKMLQNYATRCDLAGIRVGYKNF